MCDLEILPCRDNYDSLVIKKKNLLPSLPTKISIIGRSALSGKTTILSNLLCLPNFYGKDWDGDNMYIFSASLESDEKLKKILEFKEIPEENQFEEYTNEGLNAVMEIIKEKYNEAVDEGTRPPHSVVIFDDISFEGELSNAKNPAVGQLVCNMRHYLTTSIFTAQKATQLSRCIRLNNICYMVFKQPLNELETIMQDCCYIDKKQFKEIFNKYTSGRHDFFMCNLDNPPENIYCACGTKTKNKIKSIASLES